MNRVIAPSALVAASTPSLAASAPPGQAVGVLATITQPEVIQKRLECLGLPARPPSLAPARPFHQRELDFEPG